MSAPYPWSRLVLRTPPVNEPLTAAEAKARLNIGTEVSDEVMNAYIMAARQRIDGVDGYLQRALITQTWAAHMDCWPTDDGGKFRLPLIPVQQVTEISYLDVNGAQVVIAAAGYQLVQGPRPYIVPVHGSNWPTVTARPDAITVVFVAGYGLNGVDVPEPIRTAIALGAGNLHSMSAGNLGVTEEVEEGIGSTRYAVDRTSAIKVIDYTVECLLSTYQVMYV
jgi:uncharacterized phiE125 gp8 family phage protein